MKTLLLLSALTAYAATATCDEGRGFSARQRHTKDIRMDNSMLVTNTKSGIPFSNEQRDYLIQVFAAILRVVSGETSLQQEEKLFGEGIDLWQKTPEPPTLRYYKNAIDQHFSISFSKEKGRDVWVTSVLALEPQGFPYSVYRMNLPESFFTGLVLEKAYDEQRPDQPIKHVAVFVFRTKGRANDLRLQFESRKDIVEKEHRFPRDFHLLSVSRI